MGGDIRRRLYGSNVLWWLALACATALLIALNPVGFLGGGGDDWQYLNAARCWREFGPCFPLDHWQSRWPVIAPIALFTSLFGESRASVEAGPFLAAVVSLCMLAVIGNRVFGKPVGWIAALLLLFTGAFAVQVLEPSVEATELSFILLGVYAGIRWIDEGGRRTSFASGLCFSLAIQVRETALVAAVFMAVLALYRRRANSLEIVAAVLGFAIPFIVEFSIFLIEAGDPWWRLRLATRHTQLPSSELLGPIDHENSPFFNRNYIGHWKFVPGVHLYWAIDGLLNLFLNPGAGLTLILVPLLSTWTWAREGGKVSRQALMLWFAAMAYACVLIYAFAIDPKARMFVPAEALACTALGLAVCLLWRTGSQLLAICVSAAHVLTGTVFVYAYPQTVPIDLQVSEWMHQFANQIEAPPTTRQMFALVRAPGELWSLGSGGRYMLMDSPRGCNNWLKASQGSDLFVLVGEGKRSRLWRWQPALDRSICLFRYRRPLSLNDIVQAKSRADQALSRQGAGGNLP